MNTSLGVDHAEVAVARLGRVHEIRRRAGAGQGGGDLARDVAGLADAADDHAARCSARIDATRASRKRSSSRADQRAHRVGLDLRARAARVPARAGVARVGAGGRGVAERDCPSVRSALIIAGKYSRTPLDSLSDQWTLQASRFSRFWCCSRQRAGGRRCAGAWRCRRCSATSRPGLLIGPHALGLVAETRKHAPPRRVRRRVPDVLDRARIQPAEAARDAAHRVRPGRCAGGRDHRAVHRRAHARCSACAGRPGSRSAACSRCPPPRSSPSCWPSASSSTRRTAARSSACCCSRISRWCRC